MLKYKSNLPCRCGGIGIHARLKIVCPNGLVGSTPTSGTTLKIANFGLKPIGDCVL